MPNRPLRSCTTPGCPSKVDGGKCARCKGNRLDQHNAGKRPYARASWLRFRIDYLSRNPRCVLCDRMATIPDHWPVSRRDLVNRGVRHPDQAFYVRALCTACHNAQTGIHQPGGWVAQRDG